MVHIIEEVAVMVVHLNAIGPVSLVIIGVVAIINIWTEEITRARKSNGINAS